MRIASLDHLVLTVGAIGWMRSVYIRDPGGNPVEIANVL